MASAPRGGGGSRSRAPPSGGVGGGEGAWRPHTDAGAGEVEGEGRQHRGVREPVEGLPPGPGTKAKECCGHMREKGKHRKSISIYEKSVVNRIWAVGLAVAHSRSFRKRVELIQKKLREHCPSPSHRGSGPLHSQSTTTQFENPPWLLFWHDKKYTESEPIAVICKQTTEQEKLHKK